MGAADQAAPIFFLLVVISGLYTMRREAGNAHPLTMTSAARVANA